jgi:hypothetical protein
MVAQSGAVLTGDKELDKALRELGRRGTKRVMVSGVRAALTVISRAARREVNATDVDTPEAASLKAGMRKVLGARFTKKRHESERNALVGFGVGLTKSKRDTRLSKGTSAANPKSVGVTTSTKHWFAYTGTRIMKPQFKGVLRRAFAASSGSALERAKAKMRQRVPIEAEKARRKGG